MNAKFPVFFFVWYSLPDYAGPRNRDSVVDIDTGYGLDDRGVGVRVPVGSRIFSTTSRPALPPTQPPIQWVPGVPFPGVKRSVKLSTHLQLVPRSRKYGSIHPLCRSR
jgi:hypothetical protein